MKNHADNKTLFLLWPWIQGIQNSWERGHKSDRLKTVFFATLGAAFWIALLVGSLLFFDRMAQEEPFGKILIEKLIGFLFLILFAILVFSNIVTSLNTFFLSDDLYMVFAAPVRYEQLYISRFIQTLALSSWMVAMFALPVFIANGVVFEAPWYYYPWMTAVLGAFLLLPCALATAATMIMVKAFPARKMQDVLIIMAIVFVVVLYFLFRFLQPEQLFNPDIFHGFTEYFATLQAPDSSLLPTTWAKVALASGTSIQGIANQGTFYFLMMLSNGLMAILVGSIIADRIYFDAYSKSQEGGSARFTTSKRASAFFNSLVRAKGSKRRQLMVKDIRTFFRETTQWTQLLLLSALVVVYLFNYKVLHLERYAGMTFYLRNIISFVNVILAGFVMSAICVRFVLPAVSVEGRAFWILRTAPIKMSYFLWSKFFLYVIPIFIVSEVLIVVSNIFLKTSGFLMIVTSIAMAFCSLGICAIAVGVGAMYPNFEEKNVARMSTGASSIIYMVISIGFMLTIFTFIALPSYIWQIHILSKTLPTTIDWAITGVMLFLSMLVIAAAIYFPMKMGVRALETRED